MENVVFQITKVGSYNTSFLVPVSQVGMRHGDAIYHPTVDSKIKSIRLPTASTDVRILECLYETLKGNNIEFCESVLTDYIGQDEWNTCVFIQQDESRQQFKVRAYHNGQRIHGARKFSRVSESDVTKFRVKNLDEIIEVRKIQEKWCIEFSDNQSKIDSKIVDSPNFDTDTEILLFNSELNSLPFLKKI